MKFVIWLGKQRGNISSETYLCFFSSLCYKHSGAWKVEFVYYVTLFFVLKGKQRFFLEDKGDMQGIKFTYSLCIWPSVISRWLSVVLSWLIKSHCHHCFQVHFRNSTHDIKYTGKNLHVRNVMWLLFSSFFFSTLLQCCTVNIYYSYKANTKFFTRMARQFSFTLSHAVPRKRNGSALDCSAEVSVRIYLVSSPWRKREKISTIKR